MDWRRFILFVGIVLLMAGVMMVIFSDFIVTGWDPIYQKHMGPYFEAWRSIGIILSSLGIIVLIGTGFLYLKWKR